MDPIPKKGEQDLEMEVYDMRDVGGSCAVTMRLVDPINRQSGQFTGSGFCRAGIDYAGIHRGARFKLVRIRDGVAPAQAAPSADDPSQTPR